jgi:hypothetical protein
METNRAVSHVEFFAKACTAMLEVRENGRYRVNEPETITVTFPVVHITLGIGENATFLLRKASDGFILWPEEGVGLAGRGF